MDGHNTSTAGTLPYDGSGMTIGYQQGHFVDAYIKNIRVENPWNAREDLTIINRATNTGAATDSTINVVAECVGTSGAGNINIQAKGGINAGTGQLAKVFVQALSYGGLTSNASDALVFIEARTTGDTLARTDIVASTDGNQTKEIQESKVYVTAKGSQTATGTTTAWPYGQYTNDADGNVSGLQTADDGNEIHIQAKDMVVIEGVDADGRTQHTATGSVTRFEIDAIDTRINGHVHLGDGGITTSNEWDKNIYFSANIASHVFPDEDSDDTNAITSGAGWDLGATAYGARITDHHNLLTDPALDPDMDRRWRTIYVRNISAGSNSSTGTITGDWSLTSGSTLQSTYTADLAERYEADAVLEAGTVVAIGGDNEVTATTTENDENVFGVVSTEPAFIMNSKAGTDETHPMVAMTGRCPCKVVGKIDKGDRLVSASTTGRARKADLTNDSVYAIIGRAIEAHDSDGEGTIEIAVTRN